MGHEQFDEIFTNNSFKGARKFKLEVKRNGYSLLKKTYLRLEEYVRMNFFNEEASKI